jgi:hypothetical protein
MIDLPQILHLENKIAKIKKSTTILKFFSFYKEILIHKDCEAFHDKTSIVIALIRQNQSCTNKE